MAIANHLSSIGHMTENYLTFIGALIAILNPIGNTAIYIGMTSQLERKEQHKCAIHCAFSVAIILLLATWLGKYVLVAFGIPIEAFGTAGGLIVLLIAINMLRGQPHRPSYHTHVEEKTSKLKMSYSKILSIKHQIAVVPLAIPIIAGPGAITKVIYRSSMTQFNGHLIISVIVIAASAIIGFILYFAPVIGRILGEYGMKIVTRIMGLMLAAIALNMLGSNLVKLGSTSLVEMCKPQSVQMLAQQYDQAPKGNEAKSNYMANGLHKICEAVQ
jgi:multiple antibiotic resistance protein